MINVNKTKYSLVRTFHACPLRPSPRAPNALGPDYEQIHTSAECCRSNGAHLTPAMECTGIHNSCNGAAPSPSDCETECSALGDCNYFSHSLQWENCVFCSMCDFTTSGNGGLYTSWQKRSAFPISMPSRLFLSCFFEFLWVSLLAADSSCFSLFSFPLLLRTI